MPRKIRIVVAGQTPPPTGGQNVMVARLLDDLRAGGHTWEVEHLPFHFTGSFSQVRRFSLGKLAELARVYFRALMMRGRGPIDWLIYPSGGPQNAPVVRDILLLPLMHAVSRRLCIQFHAAGIADRLPRLPFPLRLLLQACHHGVDHAVVMTRFNRRDPESLGIGSISVIPHRLDEAFDARLAGTERRPGGLHLLYMGHLCPDKGTGLLLDAFAHILEKNPQARLELAGEPIPPWHSASLRAELDRLRITDRVILPGVLHGEAKNAAFARANLFVFPTVAPYESFGLVMVEAMMWGLPVLATDWRGNRDVAAGSGGFFWADPPGNLPRALADALDHKADFPRMGQSNRDLFLRLYRHETAVDPLWRNILEGSGRNLKPAG